ncbi:MAG: hypothetical protein JNG88_10360 [Phycisphaerales bacterium]|nr:hypothetical protein [Phycisphaerales bacterium]
MTSIAATTAGSASRNWRAVSDSALARAERARLERRKETQRESEGVVAAAEQTLRDAAARQSQTADRAAGGEMPTISVATVANVAFVKQVLESRLEAYRTQTRMLGEKSQGPEVEGESETEPGQAKQSPSAKAEPPGTDRLDTYA